MANQQPTPVTQLEAEIARLTEALRLVELDRQHLAYDLHDSVVQEMTAAAMLLEGAGQQARFESEEAGESFSGGLRLLRDAITQARQWIHGLTTLNYLQGDFATALDDLVRKLEGDLQLSVAVHVNSPWPTLTPASQHLLLRIVQEALHNAWKHARASEIEVRLGQNDGRLELTVADNGVGFDPQQVPAGHFGLESMCARARALGAELVFDTAPSHGTRVVVRIPLSDAGQ